MSSKSLEKRISDLEELSHEPQNYREKCEEMEKRIEHLEKTLKDFMDNWGPDVQKRRDERDARWDEMIRVLTVQKRRKEKPVLAKYDGDGNPLDDNEQYDFAEDLEGDRLVSEYNRNRPAEQWVKNINEIPK